MTGRASRPMLWRRGLWIGLGAFLAAFGLEMFLTPNLIVVGGMKGVSSLLSHVTEMQMGSILFILNVPFVLYNGVRLKRARLFWALLGLILLCVLVDLLQPLPPLVEEAPLAAAFGGLFLGAGVGLIFRYSGLTDGLQQTALLLKKKLFLSIAEIAMLLNLIILTAAGFIFGWAQAMYSVLAYIVAFKSAQMVVSHFAANKLIWIHTRWPEAVKEAVKQQLPNQAESLMNQGVLSNPNEICFIIEGREEKRIRRLIAAVDAHAVLVCSPLDTSHIEL